MFLAIDTISSSAGITIIGDKTVTSLPLDPGNSSERIIETIDKTLKKAGIGLSDLQAVFVIKGPGSFTGLRVGISVANQFAHQLKIPIAGLRTDEWWRFRASKQVLYIQSMNRAEVYISSADGARIISIEDLSKLSDREWMGELKFDHAEKLPKNFKEYDKQECAEVTWQKSIKVFADKIKTQKAYDLVEPFYGKEPNITKRKN